LARRQTLVGESASSASRNEQEARMQSVERHVVEEGADAWRTDGEIDPRYVVPGLSRGLALLQLFTRQKPEQKLTEIAEGLGLSRSATYRLVYTLEMDGFLRRDSNTRRYRLTAKVLSLGFEFLYAQPLTDAAQPFLRGLSERTRATAYLVVVDGWEAVHLAKMAPSVALITNLQIGGRFPAHAIASGRMILAHMDDAELRAVYRRLKAERQSTPNPDSFEAFRADAEADRRRGYVLGRSLFEPAISACAAPVRDRQGKAVAALSVIAPHSFVDEMGGEAELSGIVMAVAQSFSAQLGFVASFDENK
jgi:IclR family pca regulon transcriptional regulator